MPGITRSSTWLSLKSLAIVDYPGLLCSRREDGSNYNVFSPTVATLAPKTLLQPVRKDQPQGGVFGVLLHRLGEC
jgi:hypothetical protein